MAKVLRADDPATGPVQYRDRKRAWWLLSVVYPLLPFTGIALHAYTGQPIALGLPLLISYGLMPLLDLVIGEDANNPPEAVVPQLEADPYYRWLTWITVPLHFVALIGCAWWVGTEPMPWWAVMLLAYVAGTDSGLGINTGHELGHKHTALEQWLARLVLAVPAYGHFTVEHGRGHHRHVSTPEDHASARMGENIYRFALRELPGGIRRAWQLESERLAREGRRPLSLHNTMLQSYLVTAVLQVGLLLAFGWVMIPFLALHNVIAWRHFPDLPQLPSGYFGMFPLSWVPPLWFRVMDARLLALPHVRGDLRKINIDPRHRARIEARYGRAADATPAPSSIGS